eukprot:6234332-Prymnesium_polylepis.1
MVPLPQTRTHTMQPDPPPACWVQRQRAQGSSEWRNVNLFFVAEVSTQKGERAEVLPPWCRAACPRPRPRISYLPAAPALQPA